MPQNSIEVLFKIEKKYSIFCKCTFFLERHERNDVTDKSVLYARSREDNQDTTSWQKQEDHLLETARLSESFIHGHPWSTWAYVAGLWHDLGKCSEACPERLKGSGKRAVHSTAGAREAQRVFSNVSLHEPFIASILGYIIAGHHAGLPDGRSTESSCLIERLASDTTDYSSCAGLLPEIPSLTIHDINDICSGRASSREMAFGLAFFIRMLFSCLVDADRLNSEAFANLETSALRGRYPTIETLHHRLATYLESLSRDALDKPVNRIRAQVLSECLAATERLLADSADRRWENAFLPCLRLVKCASPRT